MVEMVDLLAIDIIYVNSDFISSEWKLEFIIKSDILYVFNSKGAFD